ncbi:large ribosomal subunit protein uL14m [Bacillus rossius redtenbacheri]|uniref:large ribosomal subunit protein uL14m n=1 Tax=Bacillus rossius redtenbacheri TaxID=93214 RepID=UPI002FDDC444
MFAVQRHLHVSLTCNRLNFIHLSASCNHVIKLTRLRVVDNSEIGKQAMAEGKPPRCIHIYNKVGVGKIERAIGSWPQVTAFVDSCKGDKVLVAIKGQKKKGIIVGAKQIQKPLVPKFDTNNIVLIDDNGTPLGTRIHVPIPIVLRTILKEKTHAKGADYTKLLAIASKFI